MGIVSRTRRVLRRTRRLEELTKEELFKASRPPFWRRGSIKAQFSWHREMDRFLTNSLANWQEQKTIIIQGTIRPKDVNRSDSKRVYRVRGNYHIGYPIPVMTLLLSSLPLSQSLIYATHGRIDGAIGSGIGGAIFTLFGSGGLSRARRARVFNAMKGRIYVGKRLTQGELTHNREMFGRVEKALKALKDENIRQGDLLERYNEDLRA